MLISAAFFSCRNEKKEWYYAPSDIVLTQPVFNTGASSVEVIAIYNGDDSAIAGSSFTFYSDPESVMKPLSYSCSGGRATAVFGPLEQGKTYRYGFSLTTVGGNVCSSAEDSFDYSYPHDFEYSTVTTSGSKILVADYRGLDEFIASASLLMSSSDGYEFPDVPHVAASMGQVKALFHLDEWAQDLYWCRFRFDLCNGETVFSDKTKFNLLPVPENVSILPVEFGDDVWTLSASYDGEDRTVEKAVFELKTAEGAAILSGVEGTCGGKVATAQVPAQDYGSYLVCCTLYLIDETQVSSGDTVIRHSKPRQTATFIATQEECLAAGILTEDVAGPKSFTVNGYEFETSYLRYKTSSSGSNYLVNGSSRKGFLRNVSEFQYGIKAVRLNLSQGDRLVSNYQCSAKLKTSDEWTIVKESQPSAKVFEYDLSDGEYHYFMWESKGVKELRVLSFEIDYYTEPEEEQI